MTEDRIARLERRLARERSAREEAERIAEDGMRRLFVANQELDERVAERTTELEIARTRAAQSAGERAEFLRLLSRELRAPLNGVLGMMEVLSASAESEQARAWAEDGLASAHELEDIMSRLLLFLELEEDQEVKFSTVDPGEIMTNLNSRWKHPALRSGMLLTTENRCDDGVGAHCHRADVVAVLDEVIANAIEHGDPGLLAISSSGEIGEDGVELVVFSVSDTGPGIADVAPLLDPNFHDRANSQARGMGFSLVKRLTDRTEGTLEVSSKPGSSTVVRLMLPTALL